VTLLELESVLYNVGLKINNEYEENESIRALSFDYGYIFINSEEKELSIMFHVSTPPDIAGRLILEICKCNPDHYIDIMKCYFIKNNKLFIGDEAFREYSGNDKKEIIIHGATPLNKIHFSEIREWS